MDLKELTIAMDQFVRSQGWYEKDSQRPQSPKNLAISLVLETSELLEHFQWRDGTEDKLNVHAISDELADIALYLLQIASRLNVDLEDAILKKLSKNYSRTWKK